MLLAINTLEKYKKGNVFIETGTYIGDGIRRAIKAGYKRIISIEAIPGIADAAREAFKDDPTVEIITGDSKDILPEIISGINEPITFWLDAHWLDGYEQKESKCPLYEELMAIKSHSCKGHLLLIDDINMMGKPHSWGNGISSNSVLELVKQINPDYSIEYTDSDNGTYGIIKNDILVAKVPSCCLVYTVRNAVNDLKHLRKSLGLVRDNLIPFVPDLDIIFFWDGQTVPIIENHVRELGIKNKIYFQEFTCGQPAWAEGNKSYNNMCRFWAGLIFQNPKVMEYEYYMRLDCDSFITAPTGRNLFDDVKGKVYGYLTDAIMHDASPYSQDLNKTIKEFETVCDDKKYGTIDDVREGMLYYTNFEISNIYAFLNSPYMAMFDHIDENGGIYKYRWGDHIIRYAGLHVFFKPEDVVEIKGVSYNHQTYTLINGVRIVGNQ